MRVKVGRVFRKARPARGPAVGAFFFPRKIYLNLARASKFGPTPATNWDHSRIADGRYIQS